MKRNRILARRNLNNLPKYNPGKPEATGTTYGWKNVDWGSVGTNAIGFAGSTYNAFSGNKTVEDLQAESTNEVGSGTGFTYNKIGYVNSGQQLGELSSSNTSNTLGTMGTGAALGGSIGMAAGPVGAAIGAAAGAVIGGAVGLIGGASRRSKLISRMRTANQNINRMNNYNLASAQSSYLQNQYNLDHGDMQGGQLYAANKGKDLRRPNR